MFKIFSNFRPENSSVYDGLKTIYRDKPITFFYDYIPQNIDQLNINPYNFIMIHEPNEFFGMHTWVLNNYHLFSGILTWSEEILQKCPNAILFHHVGEGGCGMEINNYLEDFNEMYPNKKFEISFLSGAKSLIEGHKFRQEIYKIENKINIPKKWFYTLDDFNKEDFKKGGVGRPDNIWPSKKICFTESMYYIGVENINYNNWYTEKITDAFATKTLPIYWGCPNLGDLGYDERGIIRFNTCEELINIVNALTPNVYYEKLPYIEYNCEIIKYHRIKNKLEEFFKNIIELNNI
jgi:hypothetical protein